MSLPAIGTFVPRSTVPGPSALGATPPSPAAPATSPTAPSSPREAPIPLERSGNRGLASDANAITRFVAERPAVSGSSGATAVDAKRAARDAEVQGKMDDLRARYAGPYQVKGASVSAGPMFRMKGGYNQTNVAAHRSELLKLCTKAGVPGLESCLIGRGTPKELTRITQLLIDNGKLPDGKGSVEGRIKQMQWEYGIGVDCAGFSFQAMQEIHGPGSVGSHARGDLFTNVANSLREHPYAEARPGDIIHLANTKIGDPGHNVVVFARKDVDAAFAATLGAKHPSAQAFLAEPGPLVALEVDSSWGAGESGDVRGGARRDTWLFNTRTKEWGTFDATTGQLERSRIGPQDERPSGARRPWGTP